MKLLILTQKVDKNDDVLGFFHAWIKEFAKHCEKITVICLGKGEYDLPENVKVLSLGKEDGVSRLGYVFHFYQYTWRERKNYDSVFVHMNKEYILLGAPIWKFYRKKIGFWHAHGHTDFFLKIAEKLSDFIFTSTESGFRLPSKKVFVVGQGIDTELFKPEEIQRARKTFEIVTVGRISPVKDYETLISAAAILSRKNAIFHITIIGGASSFGEKKYLNSLQARVLAEHLEKNILFEGAVSNAKILKYLQASNLFVNMSHTGSLDKAILEAMSSALPVITCNEALSDILAAYKDTCLFPKKSAALLAKKIEHCIAMNSAERRIFGERLRDIVVKGHNLVKFAEKILGEYNAVSDTVKTTMETTEVKKFYNVEMPKKFGADYEFNRWFKTPALEAAYKMTRLAIERHALSGGKIKQNVFELGPGAGTWSRLLLERKFAKHLDMLDISFQMLSIAKENLKEYENVSFTESDFLDFYTAKHYDFFFSSRVIEYIPDKKKVVSKISEILSPGGSGFVITKTPKYFTNKLLGRKVSEMHGGQVSPKELRSIFEKSGFSEIKIYPVTMSFPLLRSPVLNTFLYKIFGRAPLNRASEFFSESYGIQFTKK